MFDYIKHLYRTTLASLFAIEGGHKEYNGRGFLGFRLVDRIDVGASGFIIKLLSHISTEDNNYEWNRDMDNYMTILINGYVYSIKIPLKLIKPVMNSNAKYGEREFSICLIASSDPSRIDTLMLYYNYCDSSDRHVKNLSIFRLFWSSLTLVEEYINKPLDPTIRVVDVSGMGSTEMTTIAENNNLVYESDYGHDIVVNAYVTERVYRHGLGKLSILLMRLFKKPVVEYRCMMYGSLYVSTPLKLNSVTRKYDSHSLPETIECNSRDLILRKELEAKHEATR